MSIIRREDKGVNDFIRRSYITLFIITALIQFVSAKTLIREDIESFFNEHLNTFTLIAGASSVKSTSLSRTERYFVTILKKNQTFYSLIKTNSKGVIITEVIRGMAPERHFRNVSDQRWFRIVLRKHDDYFGFLKEENGRYYLFWGKPVLKGSRFVGGVALKIDLWDCFHKISSDVDEPFLIRIGSKSLYSHKWEKDFDNTEKSFEIPGVKRISFRVKKAPEPATTALAQDTSVKEPLMQDKAIAKTKEKKHLKRLSIKKFGLFQKIVLVAMLIAFLVLLFYLTKLITMFKDWRLRKKIDKEDDMFG